MFGPNVAGTYALTVLKIWVWRSVFLMMHLKQIRGINSFLKLVGQVVMWHATAAATTIVFCQNLGRQLPTLPTNYWRPCRWFGLWSMLYHFSIGTLCKLSATPCLLSKTTVCHSRQEDKTQAHLIWKDSICSARTDKKTKRNRHMHYCAVGLWSKSLNISPVLWAISISAMQWQ